MAVYDKTMAEEAIITQILQRIARQYNCELEIDYETHTVNFIGDEEQRVQIAMELEKFFTCI